MAVSMVGAGSQMPSSARASEGGNDDVSPTQGRILEVVERRPGATIVRVAGELGFAHSTATYHLNRLVQRGLVQRQRDGRTLRHFSAQANRGHAVARLAAIMRDEQRERVVAFLAKEQVGCFNINQIARILGEPFSLVKSVVTALSKAGFVDMKCVNGRYRIQTREQFTVTLAGLPGAVAGFGSKSAPEAEEADAAGLSTDPIRAQMLSPYRP